ncbi:response regulator [Brasilonema octagenarum UFV-E1]|uniref:Response regulator n=1 Tax=Brasilonema sennae CENA114 TaxID=415709 RepID=A0A856MRE6_9CYAN|nr:response regulator [Brasilonema sennae]QDL11676.1 response regulator [Brasilonema sennae CENA114]QDL18055.1 response regulator [Brasilonema octagenarum UFV-E1]
MLMLFEQTLQNQPSFLDGLRVLVVSNNDDCLWLVRVIFEECFAKTKMARSVDNAIQVIEEWRPDVIISESRLPKKDGYSLIRFIRNKEAKEGGFIPAVAITSYMCPEEFNTATDAGFQEVIYIPFEIDTLVAVITQLIRVT